MDISEEQLKKLIQVDYDAKNRGKEINFPERYKQWNKLPKVILPKVIELGRLYEVGMLNKDHLIDQHYYLGSCRNAMVARWNEQNGYFTYIRIKFTRVYPENIFHPEDDNGNDLFIPFQEVRPLEDELIREAYYMKED
jgi:hypothetical protein